ncbi:transcription initiation factor TFIIIB, Brf1 subunit/transcription initiation factor TFIIB [Halovivax ruber XH-70]|uniref:Transcription initiation factor IIB n=2 Tax=Halovivax TaxID=332951 RepID=L0I9E1_HALRX|nr:MULTISPECIES: transcription initiation factor IIB [Halovivax]AGB16230.1 transcription initiation factor TFIIIB, Brf1 subunit/transcription initiation factor TFIIB [Halovivax ruber XH-70]ELZ14344.1 Transcription factor TFIIB cyclin-related protein [Halovivax asiaticus JCM 14624]
MTRSVTTKNVREETSVGEGQCPDCETETVVHDPDRRELVCEECGLVLSDEPIDYGPEWRAFDAREHEELSRVGAPLTQSMHDRGLTTTIDWRNRDANGHSMDAGKHGQLHRLRVWQERIRTKNAGERNLKYALSEIDRMVSALGVPKPVKETASVIYRQALDRDLIRGRSIEGVATSALYMSCRKDDIPRSLEEVTAVSRVDQREIGRTYRYIADELDINLEPTNPRQFVPRFCSELDVSSEVETTAIDIIDETTELGLHSGKSPTGFAAAAIYAAGLLCEETIPQRAVAETAQTTVVTVRNRYREQLDAIDEQPAA